MKRFTSLSQYVLVSCCLVGFTWFMSACSETNEYVEEETSNLTKRQTATVTDENGNSSKMAEGTAIGVYMMGEDGSMTLQEVIVGEDGQAVLPTTNRWGAIYAYSPFQDDWDVNSLNENPVFTVQSNQHTQEQYNASDLMMASVKSSDDSDENGYQFRHMLSKVAIHVIDETGSLQLDQISVKLHHVNNSVQTDLLHQTTTTLTEQFSDILMLSKITTDWRVSSYAIVAPQTITEGTTFFTVMLFGVNYTYPIPQTTTLIGGKTFTLNIRLTLNGLVQEGWYITDWDNEEECNINIET